MTVRAGDNIPWTVAPEREDVRALLHDVRAMIHRYVVLSDEQATVVALWVCHTHALTAFDCTPYLRITSATKQAGKTRLLEVMEPLVARPWLTGRTTVAALARKVNAEQPTLLLDESDASFGPNADREYSEALRGLLNLGYRRSGSTTVCVGQGGNIRTQDFSTFGAKAIAGIGNLPGTIADRCIRIELRRRLPSEPVASWRARDGNAQAEPLRLGLARWAEDTQLLDGLRHARPEMPSGLTDRQADILEPLFAIADVAGGDWPYQARKSAVALVGTDEDPDISVELLRDLRAILDSNDFGDAISTDVLLGLLIEEADRPWADWRQGRPISPKGLATLLKPLGAHPDRLDTPGGRVRGYRTEPIREAIARYLPAYVSKRPNGAETRVDPGISTRPTSLPLDGTKAAEIAGNTRDGTHGRIEATDTLQGEPMRRSTLSPVPRAVPNPPLDQALAAYRRSLTGAAKEL